MRSSRERSSERAGRNLVGATLAGEDLRESHLARADLSGANLRRANLHGVDLRGTRLREARLDDADLRDALLDGADLRHAVLAGAAANGARLSRADLTLAGLKAADLRSTDLTEALLTDADLSHADLRRAILADADLIGAELSGANLGDAILVGANLRDAHLEGTDFSRSRFAFTVLAASDVSRAKGLEDVVHDGPSTVGIDAFLLSRGEIPDRFLVGIGLSPLAIEYLKSVAAAEEGMLVGDALFLVFHDSDRARARRLRAYLRMHRHQAWYWQELDELAGRYNPSLRQRLRVHDRLIVLVSPALVSDDRALGPVRRAIELESAEKRRLVVAVSLVAAGDLDRELDGRFLADFQGVDWDDPRDVTFRRELDRLLRAL